MGWFAPPSKPVTLSSYKERCQIKSELLQFMIPLSIPDLRGREEEYLVTCVRDNWVSSAGPFVTQFEARIAEFANRSHAVATVNGTAALHLALVAAGVQRDDFVIVPDWTFAATANAVYHAGATPIFVDVDEATWTLDPDLLAQAFEANADKKISATIVVDTLGHTGDMDVLEEICRRHSTPLIEDAAGAIGGEYKGRPAGNFGEFSTFSFNGNKTLTAGGGGMVLTDNEEHALLMTHLSKQARCGADYTHDAIGFNYRMTNVNAAIGLAQCERLPEMLGRRREIFDVYNSALSDGNILMPPPTPSWAGHNGWLYSLKCENSSVAGSLVEHLQSNGVEARTFWRSLSQQPPYKDAPKCLSGVSERLSGCVVSLPSSSSLTDGELDKVIDALKAFDPSNVNIGIHE